MSDYLKLQIANLEQKIEEAKSMAYQDPSMADLVKDEITKLEEEKSSLENALNPTEAQNSQTPIDANSIILEVRSAAGGDEAGLFASNLYRMYTRYASIQNWKIEELDRNEGGIGNIKEVTAKITGKNIYGNVDWLP